MVKSFKGSVLMLFMAFWLTVNITTPIIHALGNYSMALIIRTFYTFVFICLWHWFYIYPFWVLAIPFPLFIYTIYNYVYNPLKLQEHYLFIGELLTEIKFYFQFNIGFTQKTADILSIIMLIIISLTIYLILNKGRKVYPFAIFGALVFIPYWYLHVDSAYPSGLFYMSGLLFIHGHYNLIALKDRYSKVRSSIPRTINFERYQFSLTVIIISLVGALILPKGFSPIHIDSLNHFVHRVYPKISALRGGTRNVTGDGGEFSLIFTGFQGSSSLGGPVYQDNTVILEVEGPGDNYLRGTVKDVYTGYSWEKTNTLTYIYEGVDYPLALEPYLGEIKFNVKHVKLHTNTIFTMLYPHSITGLSKDVMSDNHRGLYYPGGINIGTEYSVFGKDLMYLFDSSKEQGDDLADNLDLYLQLPSSLPRRVRELAEKITEGYNGNYNKLKRIEEYLRENYIYRLNTPPRPQGRDFVDHFLYNLDGGYCTYFASAMAVMGRSLGIPTRYIEGFIVPQKPDGDGIFRLTGMNAHAWVEGYIPGFGWIPFEPTPAFSNNERLPLPPVGEGLIGQEPVDTESQNEGRPSEGPGDVELDSPIYPPEDAGINLDIKDILLVTTIGAIIFILIFTIISLILVLYRRKEYIGRLKEIDSLPVRERAIEYYNLTLRLLNRIEMGKLPGETPMEYSDRILHMVYIDKLSFRDLSEGINLALYSHGGWDHTLDEKMAEFYRHILKRYWVVVGKYTGIIEFYIKGII
jgi:transglutaminase-like putative cysteine protease